MTAYQVYANNATAIVTSGGTTAPSSGTVESWTIAGSTLPGASTGVTAFSIADPALPTEKILVTNISGTTATVTRGSEGTTPVAHAAGFTVNQVVTAGGFSLFPQVTGTNGPGKSVVSTGGGASVAAWAYAPVDWVNVVTQCLADNTGTTAVDTAVNAAITVIGTQGGVIYFPAGTYKVSSGLVALLAGTQSLSIIGDGAEATILEYYGSGSCIRLYNDSAYGSGGVESYFSGVHNLTIDGTNATGNAVGLHEGDITFLQSSGLVIQNFTSSSTATGHLLDNAYNWSEEGDHRIAISNCNRGVVLQVSTGTSSFGYSSFNYTFFQSAGQSCFSVLDGALLYHSPSIRIRGDVNGSASALSGNPAVIVVSGQGPSGSLASGANPGIIASHLDVCIEPNDQGGSAPHLMGTMYLDNATSYGQISACYGLLDFAEGTGAFAPVNSDALPGANNNFNGFNGVVVGDSSLNPSASAAWQTWGSGGIANRQAAYDAYWPFQQADVFTATLDATSAVQPVYGGGPGNTDAAAQAKKAYVTQPASGGPYGLTWTMTGSPSNTAPVFRWPSGVAPLTNPVANAVDVIAMHSPDGATFYGEHVASYGTGTGQVVTLAPRPQRVSLTSAFTQVSNTAAQNVTGMSLSLAPGTYKITSWFPMTQSSGTGTEQFNWTFSGTTSSVWGKWTVTQGSTATPTLITAIGTLTTASAALSSGALLFAEFSGQVVVTAVGTLQFQVKASGSASQVVFPVGCYIDAEPLF
jgi:Pectate lyase superfamily protein